MGLALDEARRAFAEKEVPVGALIVRDGEVLSRGRNCAEGDNDPTSHAEIVAIRSAASAVGNWRLSGTTLYVTLEPCAMCVGAAILARIERIVFGCHDPKSGAAGSLFNIACDERLNHKIIVGSGVRTSECSEILKDFFNKLRKGKKGAVNI